MHPPMSQESSQLVESLSALLATVWPFTGVYSQMNPVDPGQTEVLSTVTTSVGHSRHSPEVYGHQIKLSQQQMKLFSMFQSHL